MSTLADFHGIGPLANRPAAATAHALRGGVSKIAITWTDSATNTLYGLNAAGNAWVAIGNGGGGGTPLAIEDEGTQILAAASRINFAGAGVTVTDAGSGEATVTIPGGGGGGSSVAIEDEGTQILAAASRINFAGAGVTVTDAGGGEATVTIPGGSGGGSSADKFTINTPVPATPASGMSFYAAQYDSPNRSEGGSPSTVRFGLTFSHNPYAASGGQAEYTNNVAALSWNLTSSYAPLDNTKGGPSIRIESRFKVPTTNPANPGGWIDGAEFHHAMHTTGSGGIEYRPISVYAPWNNADWAYDSGVSFTAAKYTFADGYRNVHVSFVFSGAEAGDKSIFLSSQVRVSHDGNNTPWQRQMNAAGTARLSLPFIDLKNNLQVSQPLYASIVSPGLNQLNIQSVLALTGVSGFTNGARLVYLNTNAITGSATGFEAELSASTRFNGFYVRNTHASGSCGGRIVGNGGPLYLDFYSETANNQWGMSLRSDGTFAIGQQGQGAMIADAIRINYTTLQTQFMKAPKLPSATVAGAESASAAGAFALHGVTDLNATTTGIVAAGGGTNKGVIVSDGTDWRIMAAW